jgi:L-histidine N-alpha-methyltransferase
MPPGPADRSDPRPPRLIEIDRIDEAALAAEAAAGLLAPRAAVAPKFFYDALGSRLFEAITALDEYYPTRTEAAILARHGDRIAEDARRVCGAHPTLVDLGAGNCAKAESLFPVLEPARYVAVDISTSHLADALSGLQRRHPGLSVAGVSQDFARGLALPHDIVGTGPTVVFYPGSSIGNFAPDEARALLRDAHRLAAGGALLIGVDLVKDPAVLEAAYDDRLGVTAAFNLNLLRNLNRLIGSDFDPRQWRHVSFYDRSASRIEMHLEAREPLVVRWPGASRSFAGGERIHTENSYKWSTDGFAALLASAGFAATRHWCDDAGWFAMFAATG